MPATPSVPLAHRSPPTVAKHAGLAGPAPGAEAPRPPAAPGGSGGGLLGGLLDGLPDAVIACDGDDRVQAWNAAAVSLLGMPADARPGQPCRELLPALEAPVDREARATLALGGTPRPTRVPWPGPDGVLRWIELRWAPWTDGGQLRGHLRLARELSPATGDDEARRTLDELQHANQRMADARAVRTAFLAKMSHEMRTPLNAIIGFTELLQVGAAHSDSDKGREYLRLLRESGAALLSLVDDLMDLTAVEAGRLEFEPTPLDLPASLTRAVEMFRPVAQQRGVALDLDLAAAPAQVVFDERRLRQVLLNYLSNAVKFAPASGGQVRVRARDAGPVLWRLEVEDNGPGIAPEHQALLFQEFQRLPGNRQSTGTGLGLALTRRIVESRGGRVGVRSRPGQGSCFHAEFPLDASVAPPPAKVEQVYVVAPAAHLVEAAQSWVRAVGLQPVVVASVDDAVQASQARAVREITLDVRIGAEMARRLLAAAEQHCRDHPGLCIVLQLRSRPHVAEYTVSTKSPEAAAPQDGHGGADAGTRLSSQLLQGLRVLVVDDDASLCEVVRFALAEHGADARSVLDSSTALEHVRRFAPDVLLSDLLMPRMSGFELLESLREAWEEGTLPHRPVIVWTNKTLNAEEYLRLSRDADAVLSKVHVDLDALLRLVRRLGHAASPPVPPGLPAALQLQPGSGERATPRS